MNSLYVICTGRKARITEYFDQIKSKVQSGEVRYTRILVGKVVHPNLFKHANELLELKHPNVSISHLDQEYFPNGLVTEKTAILTLPDPNRAVLRSCIKIQNPLIIQRVKDYVLDILERNRINSRSDFSRLELYMGSDSEGQELIKM